VSGIVVVDADSPEALRWCTAHLKYTPWQTQTGRGFHLYYQHPGVSVRNRARLDTRDGRIAVDIRADGGYVIAPGSIHLNGHEYREAGDWSCPFGELPRFWPGLLQRAERLASNSRPARPSVSTPQQLLQRARRYLAAIPKPEIGAGSDVATLSAACRLVRGFELTEYDAVELLWEWAGGRSGWTREWVERKVQNAARFGSEPVGALR
jgi:hypothetical protein